MSVFLCLLVAPLGLLVILGLSWFEDHVLRPPVSPADQVVQKTVELLKQQHPRDPVSRATRGPG
ncbi:hypothetical protein [Streptacidiphilus rugosus]|uniref:hypothetical protein n=1 Tax=Streptacidiphilus rugosus TaxID=405783 RepID=UPI000569EBEF|nr:hypothetical protein [Streptacidiphilus rugosus]